MSFPKPNPYGWNNYPYDYYNIWVKNAGEELYMEEYAVSTNDSHPDSEFASNAVKLLYNRIIDVIENNGTGTQLTGKSSNLGKQ